MPRSPAPLLLLFAVATFIRPCVVRAQARVAVYGTVGGELSGIANQGWSRAGVIGLYADAANLGPLAVAVDVRGDFATSNRSVLAGPRLALHFPAFPIKPYSELLVGRTSYDKTAAGLVIGGKWNASYVGGVDATIFPHLDWRVFDFTYKLSESGSTDHQKTLSTGLVVRF